LITKREIAEWLDERDKRTRQARIERARLVVDHESGGRLLLGGWVNLYAFEEARLAYVAGLDLAATVLAQIALEHYLSGALHLNPEAELPRSYANVLLSAQTAGWISNPEYADLEELRLRRNPYVHYRSIADDDHPARHALVHDMTPDAMLEEDARKAITTLMRVFSRHPIMFKDDA
jgi:hypothetical protein